MTEQYIPIILMIIAGLGFGFVSVKAHEWLGPQKPNKEKLETYESGMRPITSAKERFPVKFYLVGMLFILFDIEIIFMYPWATNFKELGFQGLVSMVLFIITLFAGYIYILKKGALKWD